jgi:hypothetical protein
MAYSLEVRNLNVPALYTCQPQNSEFPHKKTESLPTHNKEICFVVLFSEKIALERN